MKNSTKSALALGVSMALTSTMASAAIVDIDVDGVESWDGPGDADNTILVVDLADALGLAGGSSVTITGIGWDVVISTVGASWLSEATVSFEGLVTVSPGAGNDAPGSMAFTSGGLLDLTDNGIPDIVLADGLLTLEFFEGYDDVADAVDSVWGSSFLAAGILQVDAGATVVPIPAALPLFAAGLGSLLLGARRRRQI